MKRDFSHDGPAWRRRQWLGESACDRVDLGAVLCISAMDSRGDGSTKVCYGCLGWWKS